MRILFNKWTGIAAYLVAVSGAFVVCAYLTHHVAKEAVAVLAQHLPDQSPRELSLVERRQIEAALPSQTPLKVAETNEVVLTAPAVSARVLAAQMDLSEKADLTSAEPAQRRVRTSARRVSRKAPMTAAEVFGRRFGVLIVAAR